MNMMKTLFINMSLASLLILIAFWLPQLNIYTEKASPYECGFDPLGLARLPFSMKFFLMAITFLLFGLEIALLLPLPRASQSINLKTTLTMALALIFLLAISLAYQWTEEGLEWNE